MFSSKIISLVIITSLVSITCTEKQFSSADKELETKMNAIAEKYVKLVLRIGQHDPQYVDAYYGPAEWKPLGELHSENDTLEHKQLNKLADSLLNALDELSSYNADRLESLRYRYLYKQLLAVKAKIFLLSGGTFTFDDEAKALYDAAPPVFDAEHFQNIIDEIDRLLPGDGSVTGRVDAFRKKFIIPAEKLDTVFTTAINECRKRTLQHLTLPPDENFNVEYVNNKSWGAYNWYKGNSYSIIQVNTDLPIYIDRAIDLAAHEGYPGHHVYNALLEQNLYRKNNWVEYSVYALYSPQSLIAEGTANYGVKIVFPDNSRIKFEKETLFPLAGLNTADAERYYKLLELFSKLAYARNEAGRNYLDGKWTEEETINWLVNYSLVNRERAEKFLSFIEGQRSYIINYNLGEDIVRDFILRNSRNPNDPKEAWKLFEYILSTPQTPSGLMKENFSDLN